MGMARESACHIINNKGRRITPSAARSNSKSHLKDKKRDSPKINSKVPSKASLKGKGKGKPGPHRNNSSSHHRQHDLDILQDYIENTDVDFLTYPVSGIATLSLSESGSPSEGSGFSSSASKKEATATYTKNQQKAQPESDLFGALMHNDDEMAYDSDCMIVEPWGASNESLSNHRHLISSDDSCSDDSESDSNDSLDDCSSDDDSDSDDLVSETSATSDDSSGSSLPKRFRFDIEDTGNDTFNIREETRYIHSTLDNAPLTWSNGSVRKMWKNNASDDLDSSDSESDHNGLGHYISHTTTRLSGADEARFKQVLNGNFLPKRGTNDESARKPSPGSGGENRHSLAHAIPESTQISKSASKKLLKAERRQFKKDKKARFQEMQREGNTFSSAISGKASASNLNKKVHAFLCKVNEIVHGFIMQGDSGKAEISLPPMPAEVRHMVELLLKRYQAKGRIASRGAHKHIVVLRTQISFVPNSWRKLPEMIIRKKVDTLMGELRWLCDNNDGNAHNGGGRYGRGSDKNRHMVAVIKTPHKSHNGKSHKRKAIMIKRNTTIRILSEDHASPKTMRRPRNRGMLLADLASLLKAQTLDIACCKLWDGVLAKRLVLLVTVFLTRLWQLFGLTVEV
ncbi:hypothetical protein BASA83_007775 [Batrachochytrium salamandrivorans]|nr:hypothetical protein BASA83_007775 [Batrachochytrium salamandrivorans]